MTLAEVYACDKVSADICRQMTQVGFAYDTERAAQFRGHLFQLESEAMQRADDAARPIKRGKSGSFSTNDLAQLFFRELRAPALFFSETTGRPALNVDALQAYANGRNAVLKQLSLAVLAARRARKLRSTYIDSIKVGSDGRVHPGWLNYGTVSGRWSCQGPNLANLPRGVNDPTHEMGGIRSLYHARPGYVLVGYDKSQIEFRIAAYGSGDEAMIAVCEGGDVHSMNAAALFAQFTALEYARIKKALKTGMATEEDTKIFTGLDGLRTLAKSAVFAICYLAEAPTVHARIVASGITNVTLRMVEAMLQAMKRRFASYYAFQDERLHNCVRLAYTESPILGRRRWLGHDPSPPECANFLCQAGAADVMNREIPAVYAAVRKHSPTAALVAHVYDSVYFEVPASHSASVRQICLDISLRPVHITSSGVIRHMTLPVDIDQSERWH